ncbi:MAG: hypothetical protein GKS00_06580 [Alphaproteobacteria bacterium]|nr:hypothetical protein [Alphaproteobacteria bacterium]
MALGNMYKEQSIGNTDTPLQRIIKVLACLLVFVAAEAHAGKPAALALDVSGPTTPAVEPFSELETKAPIVLDAETTIEFLHYKSCQAVTVKGGRLNFTEQRYLYKGGKIVSTKRAECPKSVALSGASQIGGVVLRSAGGGKSALKVTTRPSFVLVGPKADGFMTIRISQKSKLIVEAKLASRVFHYPKTAPTLEKGQSYEVTLSPAGGGKPRNFSLKARGRPKKNALTLIRVD